MKVFVSWSGDPSREVAEALRDWLPNVIQAIDVFVSSRDIQKGAAWFHELGKVLDSCDFGILCLTRENMTAPWILYEAGALAMRFEAARVVPLLIGLENKDLGHPLSNLNAAGTGKDEIGKVVSAINIALGAQALGQKQLDAAFDTWWPSLERKLKSAVAKTMQAASRFRYDVFLSAPMAAYADDAAYKAGRVGIKKIFDTLITACALRVYWAAEKIESMKDFDTVDVSVEDDLRAVEDSRYFILFYPEPLATSALFEAGYALALRRVSHYFVRDRQHLPFLLRELSDAGQRVRIHTNQDWADYDDLASKLAKNMKNWFPA